MATDRPAKTTEFELIAKLRGRLERARGERPAGAAEVVARRGAGAAIKV